MNKNILILDDDENVLHSFARLFRKSKLKFEYSDDPLVAKEFLHQKTFAVVIADYNMAGMNGIRFLNEVELYSPSSIRVLLTGHTDSSIAIDAINKGQVYRFISKPWIADELSTTIDQCVQEFELRQKVTELHDLSVLQNNELRDLNKNLDIKVKERSRELHKANDGLKESLLGMIGVISELTENHCHALSHHPRRVANLAKSIAEKYGLSSLQIWKAEMTALVHDVGKVTLPPNLVKKPRHLLKDSEEESLQGHILAGEHTMRMIPYLKDIAVLMRHQEENYSGGGFPDGLKYEEIPIVSRILKISNAYDEWRNGVWGAVQFSHENVMDILTKITPDVYDPDLLGILGDIFKNDSKVEGDLIEIRVQGLSPGMICAKDIHTLKGILLLPGDTCIQAEHIKRIQAYQKTDPVIEAISIYREGA
ncbi:MAG: response regulator [Lentisphaeria bacterium]|nr:response regulator [Lentisphaeria bacterium]NQZ66783.1 response regulator [Lentisphaeria bacterium]